jgi:hypothetical protein
MITWENYEEYIVRYADKELRPEEERALMTFIAANPELNAELKAYETLRMEPDETIMYENKELLIKPVPANRILIFPHWQRYAVAAGIAALVLVSLVKWGSATNETNAVSTGKTNDQHIIAAGKANPSVTRDMVSTKVAVVKDDKIGQPTVAHVASTVKLGTTRKTGIVKAVQKIDDIPSGNHIADGYGPARLSIKELPGMDMKTSPVEVIRAKEIDISAPVAVTRQIYRDADKKDFLNNLHLDEANRDQVKEIKKVFSGAYNHVKGITIKVKDESLAVIF